MLCQIIKVVIMYFIYNKLLLQSIKILIYIHSVLFSKSTN